MQEFRNYRDGFNAAVALARTLGRETGLLRSHCPLARCEVFRVYSLPKPANRYGFELRCQIVRPDEPPMAEVAA